MKTMDQKEFARENVFGLGAENTAYAKYFTGNSHLAPLTPKNLSENEKTMWSPHG